MKIPQNKKHIQTNKGEFSGSIYASKNINLDEEGYIKLSETPIAYFTQDNNADLDPADAMFPSDGALFINGDEVFSGTLNDSFSLTNRSTDTGSPSPGVEEDVIYFNATEVVSDGASIYYRSASTTWTAISMTGFTTTVPTAMAVWGAENVLAVGNNNKVKFVDTSWAVSATVLTLPSEYQVSSMTSVGSTLYIATRSKSGAEAKLFTVNTIATAADNAYGCGAYELPTIKPFKSSIVGLTSLGQLVAFTGGGFKELASLPVYATRYQWGDALNDYANASNRSLFVDGDLVYINLNSDIDDGLVQMLPNFPSGVWCYDDTSGSFYHRYSPSLTKVQGVTITTANVDTTTNVFTLGSGNLNDVVTGMPSLYDDESSTSIPELRRSTPYFIIKVSSTTFKLAETYADAIAGTAIDITGTGNNSQKFYIFKTNDYGWYFHKNNRMCMAVMNNTLYDTSLFGRIVMSNDLNAKQAITTGVASITAIVPFIPNRGYYITPKIESNYIDDTWQRVYVNHKPLKNDDTIIIKCKVKDAIGYPKTSVVGDQQNPTSAWVGTWTDTDTFTTQLDLSDAVAGDEIEIISGVGAGHIAHISSISVNSGTYTVNLDEAFPFAVANDQMYFMCDKWIKLGTFTASHSTNAEGYIECPITDNDALPISSKFIQFKIEMRGIEVTIEELQVSNQGNKYTSLYN
jgi:hypothetical protein